MSIIAIIPARSGSKGVTDKNIKELDGKPLMAYTIEAALNSHIFDCVHVSTDSPRYAEIARAFGAEVPFLRSNEFATDGASTWSAVNFVLEKYEKVGKSFDTLAVLQPTSPLRDSQDIRKAYEIMQEKNAKSVIAICEVEHSPLWTDTIAEDGNMYGFVDKKYRGIARQQMPAYYRVNGAIYLIKKEQLQHISELYDQDCYAYIMDRQKSVDIDSELDFMLAECIHKTIAY